MADMVINVEVDREGPSSPPAVKGRLEQSKAKMSPEELGAKLQRDMALHDARHQKHLDEVSRRGHDEVEHAKEVARHHRRLLALHVKEMHDVLKAKEEWADLAQRAILVSRGDKGHEEALRSMVVAKVKREEDLANLVEAKKELDEKQAHAAKLHEKLLAERAERGHAEVLKAVVVAAQHECEQELAEATLRYCLHEGQELASRNRSALEQYKTTAAAYEVEHAMQVHAEHEKEKEYLRQVMDSSYKRQQEAASTLREHVNAMSSLKGREGVEHAEEVHTRHSSDEAFKTEHLAYKNEQKEIAAYASRESQLSDRKLKAHEEVEHAKEVAADVREERGGGGSEWEADDEGDACVGHLAGFSKDMQEEHCSLEERFREHLREFLDYDLPDELNPYIRD